MIRKIILVAVFILMSFYLSIGAQNNLGIGIIIGEPTGISAKFYLGKDKAFDAGAGWSLVKKFIRVHGDFLLHNDNLMEEKLDLPLTLYYGAGVKLLLGKDFGLGLRIPLGLLYNFKEPHIDLFLELVPGLDLLPDTNFGFDAAFGGRYYFTLKR